MIRFALAFALGGVLASAAMPAWSQQAASPNPGASAGQNCKKVYVQKKSQRTGQYVHVPRQRCS